MIYMKRKRISFILTSEPCSINNWIISIEFALIAILRGLSLILREFRKALINLKRKRIIYNNDKYEKKKNYIKQ